MKVLGVFFMWHLATERSRSGIIRYTTSFFFQKTTRSFWKSVLFCILLIKRRKTKHPLKNWILFYPLDLLLMFSVHDYIRITANFSKKRIYFSVYFNFFINSTSKLIPNMGVGPTFLVFFIKSSKAIDLKPFSSKMKKL